MTQRPRLWLAADVGGSRARLGLFDRDAGWLAPREVAETATADSPDIGALVRGFLRGRRIQGGSVAVAGTVVNGTARGPNLPWPVTRQQLVRSAGGAPVRLLNDLEALGHCVAGLQLSDPCRSEQASDPNAPQGPPLLARPVRTGGAPRGGPIGVLALGTGIGASSVVSIEGCLHVLACELGHVDFAPADGRQQRYLMFLRARHGHVSVERACSGASVPALYEFLCQEMGGEDPETRAGLSAAPDPTSRIVDAGLGGRCAVCHEVLQMLVAMLGAVAGNLALQVVATGGLYIGGGLAVRLLPLLRSSGFDRAFRDKGRFAEFVGAIPVTLLAEPLAGLYGAARHALAHPPLTADPTRARVNDRYSDR